MVTRLEVDRYEAVLRIPVTSGWRGSFLLWSALAHLTIGAAAGVCVVGRSAGEPRAYAIELSLSDGDRASLEPLHLEPEAELEVTHEPLLEPRLVEVDLPPPSVPADLDFLPETLVEARFEDPSPWPIRPMRQGRHGKTEAPFAVEAELVGSAEIASSCTTPAPTSAAQTPVRAGKFVAAQPDRLASPPPAYPREARHRSWEGTATLELEVGADGTVLSAILLESSGHAVLDEAARAAVLAWRFQAATRDGIAEVSRVRVPIVWKLTRAAR